MTKETKICLYWHKSNSITENNSCVKPFRRSTMTMYMIQACNLRAQTPELLARRSTLGPTKTTLACYVWLSAGIRAHIACLFLRLRTLGFRFGHRSRSLLLESLLCQIRHPFITSTSTSKLIDTARSRSEQVESLAIYCCT